MGYEPGILPKVAGPAGNLAGFVQEELRLIADNFIEGVEHTSVQKIWHEPPPKPRDAMIVYADGADWNPGSGVGFYGRENGAWVKL